MNSRLLTILVLSATVSVFGCSSGGGGTAGTGGDGGSGATGGAGGAGGGVTPKTCADIPDTTNYIVANAPETSSDDCNETNTLSATGDNDQTQIITAILNAGANGVVCLEAGDYDMGGTIDITTAPGLTLKGIGASPDDVVLDYNDDEGNCRGAQGINVSVDNVTIENMWVKNSCENAVVQRNVDGSVFRKVRVSWDGEPRTENGAYGIYPTDCQNTLVEYCQTQGASDAGVYVGKCDGGIVQYNVIYENVAGLEVENSLSVDVMNNEIFNNTGGLLALQQDISGDMQTNSDVRMFDNEVYCNNYENFAQPGSAVSGIPVGTGGLSFVGNGIEFFGNEFTDNLTLGIGLASNILNCQVATSDCPPYSAGYDPYVRNIYAHDNLFTNNGMNPQGDFGDLFNQLGFGENSCDGGENAGEPCKVADDCPGGACAYDGGPPVPSIVWDGYQPRVCDVASDNAGDSCYSTPPVCVGGDNAGDSCEGDGDCPNGTCFFECPNGECVLSTSNPNDAGICLGTDADAAASFLNIGDPCGSLSVTILQYVLCAQENSSTDQADYLCAP